MVLDPLAEVGVGVLVAIVISGGEFVVDLQRRRKRRQRQEDQRDGDSKRGTGTPVSGEV
ncbi:MAG: hypothetical protein AABZ22_06310 [Nitrospirota bacterium]|jgi:hypothetical protein